MKKRITILGSTGSIGLSTLKIIDKKKNYFFTNLLSANKNFKKICEQIYKYRPKIFVITDKRIFKKVHSKFRKKNVKIYNNFEDVNFIKNDITISAIPGIAGLEPTIKMIKTSKKMLIANKESIVCGWNLIKKEAKKYKSRIIPVDSEHFSILKLIKNYKLSEINKVYLTASGGPFLNFKKNQLKDIKPKDALKHPTWKMGRKVSIDSATLVNKMLEIIEAQKIFNLPDDKLEILIHPESLVHAVIDFKNGLKKFIYHDTSMIIPLANAIFDENFNIEFFYNKKRRASIESLRFKRVDKKIFPIIKIKKRLNEYPSTPIIINASNEILVDQFLNKKLPFLSIPKIIMSILSDRNYKKYAIRIPENISQINIIDNWAKTTTMKKIRSIK